MVTIPQTSSTAMERYAAAAHAAGCPKDQFLNFAKHGIVLQPKQLQASAAARLCDLPGGPMEIGFGGARGGGKSHWGIAQIAIDDCQRCPGLKCLLLRKVGKANKENFNDLRLRMLMQIPHKYNRQEGILTFENGSRIIVGHFQNESDIDTYLGLEYDVILVEEATTLTPSKMRDIRTCNRSSKPNWRPRIYNTTNPGNIGHAWYKAEFVIPYQRGEETWTRFIPSTVDDNTFVNPEYRQRNLETLTGWKLRAWRYGDWDIAAGQFFTTFRRDVHVRNVQPMPHWRYWCSLDYGFTHYTVVYLFCKDDDGNVYCLDEHAERRWQVKQHADAVKAMLARYGLTPQRLWKFVAGHDVWAKKDDGPTIADKYAAEGIRMEHASIDRINGASEMQTRFGDVDAVDYNGVSAPIEPTFFIHSRCARLIECIPAMQHDPHRPEDVLKVDCDEDGIGGDDPYDAGRYGLMADWKAPTTGGYNPVEVLSGSNRIKSAPAARPVVRSPW